MDGIPACLSSVEATVVVGFEVEAAMQRRQYGRVPGTALYHMMKQSSDRRTENIPHPVRSALSTYRSVSTMVGNHMGALSAGVLVPVTCTPLARLY